MGKKVNEFITSAENKVFQKCKNNCCQQMALRCYSSHSNWNIIFYAYWKEYKQAKNNIHTYNCCLDFLLSDSSILLKLGLLHATFCNFCSITG